MVSFHGDDWLGDLSRSGGRSAAQSQFATFPWHEDSAVRKLPIGVFDSGIGGFTVLDAILRADSSMAGEPDFASERFVYFGDQANMPYGSSTDEDSTNHLRDLIVRNGTFLVEPGFQQSRGAESGYDKPPVKAIVLACNTASTVALHAMRERFVGLPVVVAGIIESGALGVLKSSGSGGVGILATPTTCESNAYPGEIRRVFGLAGRTVPPVAQQACPTLASLIGGNSQDHESIEDCIRREVTTLLRTYRDLHSGEPLRTVVLGCTHYPLVLVEFEATFNLLRREPEWRNLIAKDFEIVDPAIEIVREIHRELAERALLIAPGESCVLEKDQFYISMRSPNRIAHLGQAGGLPGGDAARDRLSPDAGIAPLDCEGLPLRAKTLLKERFATLWERLTASQG